MTDNDTTGTCCVLRALCAAVSSSQTLGAEDHRSLRQVLDAGCGVYPLSRVHAMMMPGVPPNIDYYNATVNDSTAAAHGRLQHMRGVRVTALDPGQVFAVRGVTAPGGRWARSNAGLFTLALDTPDIDFVEVEGATYNADSLTTRNNEKEAWRRLGTPYGAALDALATRRVRTYVQQVRGRAWHMRLLAAVFARQPLALRRRLRHCEVAVEAQMGMLVRHAVRLGGGHILRVLRVHSS
jgi:hypothetical protein